MTTRIQLRRGTSAEWHAANPVLAPGEPGYSTDTGYTRHGDGVTAWRDLPDNAGPPGPVGPPVDTTYLMQVVTHGSDASAPRPIGAAAVYWIGDVEPENGAEGDLWLR